MRVVGQLSGMVVAGALAVMTACGDAEEKKDAGKAPSSAKSDGGDEGDDGDETKTGSRTSASTSTGTGTATGTGTTTTACVAPAGVDAAPKSIAAVVTLLNAMPHPVTMPCFLEVLARPLALELTDSTESVQPAAGKGAPRVFVRSGPLVLTFATVANDKDGHTIEMSELMGTTESVKAEILFPVVAAVTPEAPFRAVLRSDGKGGTRCAACHFGERAAGTTYPEGAFVSKSLRPGKTSAVSIETLKAERGKCGPNDQTERCQRLRAVFDHGDVTREPFPEGMETFFGE